MFCFDPEAATGGPTREGKKVDRRFKAPNCCDKLIE